MTTRSLAKPFSMMRAGRGAHLTPCSSQALQARFSRFHTRTKYWGASRSSCSLCRVADDHGGPAASAADASLRAAGDELLDAGQLSRPFLSARMGALRLGRQCYRPALALGGHFGGADPRFGFQQLQLRVGERLAAGPVFVDAHQA